MAANHADALKIAEYAKELADEGKAWFWRIKTFLKHNSAMSIDWAGDPKPGFLNEDADGNIDGAQCSRGDLANFIGSLDQARKYFENESVSQGDHLGNYEKIASAEV